MLQAAHDFGFTLQFSNLDVVWSYLVVFLASIVIGFFLTILDTKYSIRLGQHVKSAHDNSSSAHVHSRHLRGESGNQY